MVQRFGFSAARSIHSYIRDNCDRLFICTTAPATYSAASNQPQMLVSAAVTGDEWTITSGAQGPALTFNTRTLTIEGSGSASHMVFANASASRILAVTDVCAGTSFTSGNTVTVPVWRAEIVAGDSFFVAAPRMDNQGTGVWIRENLISFQATGWTAVRATVASNVTANVGGAALADKFSDSTDTGDHYIEHAVSIKATGQYKFGCVAKKDVNMSARNLFLLVSAGDGVNPYALVDVSSNSVVGALGNQALSADVRATANGYSEAWVIVSLNPGPTTLYMIFSASGTGGLSYTGASAGYFIDRTFFYRD
jgi:hypothetical protein